MRTFRKVPNWSRSLKNELGRSEYCRRRLANCDRFNCLDLALDQLLPEFLESR